MRRSALSIDLAILLALLALALLFFWPVTVGGKTLLPADIVGQWEPWKSTWGPERAIVPRNALAGDLYLENYAWKRLIREALQQRELPLWNPYLFAGVPFLAAGQHSALYPFSILFYVLPLPAAYGWFAALHLFLAGAFAYALARTLGLTRHGAALAAVTFEGCGFIVISNVFPMIVAAAVWLPPVLIAIERIVRRTTVGGMSALAHVPDIILGAASLGMVTLAGHPEMYYYVGLTAAFYAVWRALPLAARARPPRSDAALAVVSLIAIALLGLGLGTAQWWPLLDLVRHSFRAQGASFRDVLSWAYPLRHLGALLMPDIFGNPAVHTYLDLFTWRQTPVTVNALGQPITAIDWGTKNYVEGAAYVGVLPLVLALIALWRYRARTMAPFAALAGVALLMAFGSPLYYLVYRLPGMSQVHTPFRWVYPYSLCLAVLAGMGIDALLADTDQQGHRPWERLRCALARRWIPSATLAVGISLLLVLVGSLAIKERVASLADTLMRRLAKAPEGFADGRMFLSFEFRNLLVLAVTLAVGGALLLAVRRGRQCAWAALVAVAVAAELLLVGARFFPRTDPALVAARTPAIDYLLADPGPYRVTALVGPDEKTLNANTGMFYGIEDVRGYDSIIPRPYVDYISLLHPQGELIYNRIAPVYADHAEALDSPLLDMLNVKYVLASRQQAVTSDRYTLVYDREIRIYRNEQVMPRAYLVSRAVVIDDPAARERALTAGFDPRREVILEHAPLASHATGEIWYAPATSVSTGLNETSVLVDAPTSAILVLADAYWDGWLAFVRDADADPATEQQVSIYRANGIFRAVEVPAGRSVVRFRYSPAIVKYGLYISFLSAVVLALALGLYLWQRLRRGAGSTRGVERVARNTVAPLALNIVNKIIDMAFAMLMLRILGPADAGQYYLAVVIISWFDIFTNYGLNALITRDVARDHAQAARYLSSAARLRVVLWAASWPVMAAFLGVRSISKPIDGQTVLAIALFLVGLLPSNISATYSAIFSAYERMEVPAAVSTLTTLLKVALGTVALFLGTRYVGLAWVSIVVNIITMGVLRHLLLRLISPSHAPDSALQRQMLRDSWPLMVNLLLATLFFKVAVFILEWLLPDPRVLGWYSTAYKYIDAVGLVPAYFTLAIFPLMSRYAATDREALLRAYRMAVKLLTVAAVGLGFVFSLGAREWIALLGGSQYLPEAARILRVMIWYMPFGFINSVTQYVLIALDQQRFLTRAFAIGLSFSVLANIALITRFGYVAAAYVAIASEFVLLIPFYVGIRRHLARIPWLQLAWKPWLSALPMALLTWLLPQRLLPVGLLAGLVLYGTSIICLRVFDATEREVLGRALPMAATWQRLRRGIRSALG